MIIVLIGTSGTGKSTLMKRAKKNGYSLLRSTTTRKPRNDFSDSEYMFTTKKNFNNSKDGFVEWIKFDGNLYGTRKCDVNGNKICAMTLDGALKMERYCNENGITIRIAYLWYSDIDTIKSRLKGRKRKRDDTISHQKQIDLTDNRFKKLRYMQSDVEMKELIKDFDEWLEILSWTIEGEKVLAESDRLIEKRHNKKIDKILEEREENV